MENIWKSVKYFLLDGQDSSEHSEDDADLADLHGSPLPGPQLDDGFIGGRV